MTQKLPKLFPLFPLLFSYGVVVETKKSPKLQKEFEQSKEKEKSEFYGERNTPNSSLHIIKKSCIQQLAYAVQTFEEQNFFLIKQVKKYMNLLLILIFSFVVSGCTSSIQDTYKITHRGSMNEFKELVNNEKIKKDSNSSDLLYSVMGVKDVTKLKYLMMEEPTINFNHKRMFDSWSYPLFYGQERTIYPVTPFNYALQSEPFAHWQDDKNEYIARSNNFYKFILQNTNYKIQPEDLFTAIRSNQINIAHYILDNYGCNPKYSELSYNLLHVLAEQADGGLNNQYDYVGLAKKLIDKKVDFTVKNGFGKTAYDLTRDINLKKYLRSLSPNELKLDTKVVFKKPSKNQYSDEDLEQLFVAVGDNDIEKAKILLDKGVPVNQRLILRTRIGAFANVATHMMTSVSATPLGFLNAVGSDTSDIRYVENGYTPILIATRRGHYNMVKLLLEYGANANSYVISNLDYDMDNTEINKIPDSKVHTYTLRDAYAYGHSDIVKLLLDNGANKNIILKDRGIYYNGKPQIGDLYNDFLSQLIMLKDVTFKKLWAEKINELYKEKLEWRKNRPVKEKREEFNKKYGYTN
jgi:ankyrin repeat protein